MILVWSERPDLLAELLGEARRLAVQTGTTVGAVSFNHVGDDELASLAASGADSVYVVEGSDASPDSLVGGLVATTEQMHPHVVLIGATKLGLDVAPRVVERTAAGYGAWAVSCELDEDAGEVSATCMIYAGAGLATYRFAAVPTVLTCAPGTFSAKQAAGRSATCQTLELPDLVSPTTVVERRPKVLDSDRLTTTKTVVDVGQGVRDERGIETCRALAVTLEAQLGCSRPIATTREWFAEWLGLSGAKIKPELCLTVGISGAIQHMIGIRNARVIAAINNDENAAIFLQADVGVVADLYEFLPVLIERMEARDVHPA